MGLGTSLLTTLPIAGGSAGLAELLVLGPAALGAFGVVGASILDRILDTDSENGDEDALADDAGGGLGGMGDMGGMGGMGGMDDDMGGMGGMDDDMGGMEFDDEMGGFGDEMGGFDEGAGNAGADVQELEHQLDELENEVASLSSTVSTVRSENTEISERIEDVEEDVRNLLDIYEMVTRGINPFVDEGADDLDLGGESLGLFDDGGDGGEADTEAEVDESVMSADAEGFFDDDFEDDEGDEDDEFEDAEAIEDDFEDETESEEMVSDQSSSGGKSFSELKEEYDSGEADWADDGEDADGEFEEFDEFDDSDEELGEFDDSGEELGEFDDSGDDLEVEVEPSTDPEPSGESDDLAPIETAESKETAGGDGFEYVQSDQLASGSDKPYLTQLPGDYVGDLVVMEWLEFLVEESDVTDAARAINYYERIEWIAPEVAEQLRSFLSGFGDVDRNKVDRPGTEQLTRSHHIKSLKYVMQLNGTTATSVILDRWDMLSKHGGGSDR